jgi:hypothetical protein
MPGWSRTARTLTSALGLALALGLGSGLAVQVAEPPFASPGGRPSADLDDDLRLMTPELYEVRRHTLLQRFRHQDVIQLARRCLEQRAPKPRVLGTAALQELTAELVATCFAPAGSWEQESQRGALPYVYAIHEASGLPIQLDYFCTDVCPKYGDVLASLVGPSEQGCLQIGGVPDRDNGWQSYSACLPDELLAWRRRGRLPPPSLRRR